MTEQPLKFSTFDKSKIGYLYVGVFLFAFLLPLFFAMKQGIRPPQIHDEHAYLLHGETFANGRITNPTHPMKEFFETFHVIFEPTYTAKFPPGQGAFLALGILLFDEPAVGVWISAGVAAAALLWFLLAFLRVSWAILSVLLFLLSPPVFFYWHQSYWGGTVAFAGGCLYFGALVRLSRSIKLRDTLWLVISLAILTNTRPYESAWLFGITFPFLILRFYQQRADLDLPQVAKNFIAPFVLGSTVIVAWHLFYNWSVSDDCLQIPYLLWDYRVSHNSLIKSYRGSSDLDVWGEILRVRNFYFYGISIIALPPIFFVKHRRLLIASLGCLIAMACVIIHGSRGWPHYFAPAAPLFYLLIPLGIIGASELLLGKSQHAERIGLSVLVFIVGCNFYNIIEQYFREPVKTWGNARLLLAHWLEQKPGKHVVFVKYSSRHNIHMEWVYNHADIDGSDVIFARDLGEVKDRELLDYFRDRQFWYIEPDVYPLALKKYRRE